MVGGQEKPVDDAPLQRWLACSVLQFWELSCQKAANHDEGLRRTVDTLESQMYTTTLYVAGSYWTHPPCRTRGLSMHMNLC